MLTSICVTVSEKEPQWFIIMFSKILWPLGNIYITVSVLLVVAVSTERYLAICRPLQYKPKAAFFIILVFATSMSVNIGRFFEFRTEKINETDSDEDQYSFVPTDIMGDERYIMFSRYWTEIFVTGVLPLLALVFLNYGIYTEIRNSAKFRQNNDRCGGQQPMNKIEKMSKVQIRSTVNVKNFDLKATTASTFELTSSRNSTKTDPGCQQKTGSMTSIKSETIVAITTRRLSIPTDESAQISSNSHITVVKTSTVKLLTPSSATTVIDRTRKRSNDRSTQLLIGIVLVFLICHTVRLVIQIDAIIHPSTIGGQHYDYCKAKGLFHSPVAVWILTSFNVLCLVLNSR